MANAPVKKHHEPLFHIAKRDDITGLKAWLIRIAAIFVGLVISRRRTEFFHRMLYSFLSQYREFYNIKVGRLMTALPAEGLKERMEELFHARTGAEVHLDVKVNPEILGGFVFELDDWKLDASVATQIRKISRRLIDNNNRIV